MELEVTIMSDDIIRTPREQVGHWLARVSRRRFQLSETLLEQMGVGPGQVPILTQLNYHGELTQRELAEHTNVTAATISGTLKRMERADIVYRTEDKRDARVSIVRLTEKGQEIAKTAREQFAYADSCMLDGFSDEECDQAINLLKRMRENVDRALEKANGQNNEDA